MSAPDPAHIADTAAPSAAITSERLVAEPDYLILATGLGRLYGARSDEERRHREQDAAYLLTLLREAGYTVLRSDSWRLRSDFSVTPQGPD